MPLADYQRNRCLKVMDQIQKHVISRMFSQPVNPINDNCPDYFTKVTTPMDLGTARKKLESNVYDTVEQWKDDMELIWNNAYAYNGTKALISLLAKEIQTMYRECTTNLSSDIDSDWNSQFEKLKTELNTIIKLAPKAVVSSKPSRRSQGAVNQSSSTSSLSNIQRTQSAPDPQTLSANISASSSSVASTAKKIGKSNFPNTNQNNSNNNSNDNSGGGSNVSNKSTSTKTVPQKSVPQKSVPQKSMPTTRSTAPTMSKDEIRTLTDEVNLIEDPEQVQQVIDLVKRLEPSIEGSNDEDEFVLDIENLKDGTLFELRQLVSQILGH